MLSSSLTEIITRDLNKLKQEINLFPDEGSVWKVKDGVTNSAGNLCLHLCGNLQHYIGAVLGGSGYQRNRDNEFAARGIPREKLVAEIDAAIKAVQVTIPSLSDAVLQAEYPADVFGKPMKTGYFLIHLSAHLGYHLGQVNYLRRMLVAGYP